MARKYKVFHLITLLELGGAQQNTMFCVSHHDRRRFRVGLVAGRGAQLDDEARAIADADVHLVSWLRHPISPLSDLLAVLKLRRLLREREVDLVHTHSSKAGIVGRLAALLAGVPVIVHTAHGWSFNDTQPAWRRRMFVTLERLAGAISDLLIVVAARHRETGLASGVGRADGYAVVRSGIDPAAFSRPPRSRAEVRAELGFEDGDFVVGTVACMKPQKAPLDFVDAAAAAYAKNGRLRFFIAGGGELMPQVRARIAELGLDRVILLLGWRDDVPDLLHAMDLFLLTSLFEGLPRAVLQAMAAGTPVVATAVDGTPEVVLHGETGLLTPPGDPVAAAERLLQMAGDEALRLRCTAQARRRLDAEFDIHRMVRRLDEVYLGLLEGASPSG